MRLLPAVFLSVSLAAAQKLEFDAASIKPNTSQSEGMGYGRTPGAETFDRPTDTALIVLIATAYKLKEFQISGGPSWIRCSRYNVITESAHSNVTPEQFR